MQIAIASGKGGTGKTTLAVNLALAAAARGLKTSYLDCDVEQPNGALFLRPEFVSSSPGEAAAAESLALSGLADPAAADGRPVYAFEPHVAAERCTGCGRCGEICRFSAIVPMGRRVLVFPELCHACEGCLLVCPSGAISAGRRTHGRLQQGYAGAVHCVQGLLEVGQPSTPPLIRAVLNESEPSEAPGEASSEAPDEAASAGGSSLDVLRIVDAPPGTGCGVVAAMRRCDYVLLVTESTPFGQHDLELAVELVRGLGLSFGVAVNRAGMGDGRTVDYCRREGIEVLAELPDDPEAARAYARGAIFYRSLPAWRMRFDRLLGRLLETLTRCGPQGGRS